MIKQSTTKLNGQDKKTFEIVNIVYRIDSDNFTGVLTPVAYRQLCLSMSSGDFGAHKKERLEFSSYELGRLLRDEKLEYVELFDENFDKTTLKEQFQDIVNKLTLKQYVKIMGGTMLIFDKLEAIKKITKNKKILEKVDFLLNAYSEKGYLFEDVAAEKPKDV